MIAGLLPLRSRVPPTTFCLLLCVSLATLAERAGEREARRLVALRTGYVVVLVGPILVYGGGVDALAVPVAVLSVLANVALVYVTFTVSKRPWSRTEGSPSPAAG